MRLLVITNMFPTSRDPYFGTFVKNFVNMMSELNVNGVTKCIYKGRTYKSVKGIVEYLFFYWRIFKTLILEKYDIIYIHTISYTIIPILLISPFRKLRIVFNVHGADVLTRSNLADILKKIAKPLIRKADMLVSPSFFFKKILLREFPFVPEKKIFVSPSGGINKKFFSKYNKERKESYTIGYVSRISEDKGWDTLLKSAVILKERKKIFKIVFAGKGTQVDEFKTMIKDLALADVVTYIGPVEHESLPALFQSFDIFVFPTKLQESLGLVGLEAMACHVPVIGSKIGGLTDYILDGSNSYFFEPGNENDLANKLEEYMHLDSNKKDDISSNAYRTALDYESYSISYKLYNKLISLIN